MVTDVHDGSAHGPVLTTTEEVLLVFVRRMDADAFARVFRMQLSDSALISIIKALPRDRLSRLASYARNGQFESPSQQRPTRHPMARAIRVARKRAGMNQIQLAEKLGVRQSSVSQWERGQTEPTGQRVVELLRALPSLGGC